MARLSRSAAVGAFAFAPVAACGARTGLPADQYDQETDNAVPCIGVGVPILPSVPNLYFVLDASGSMVENSKWANVRSVVAGLVSDVGANARFGATVFPAPGANQCAAGVEVMPLQLGDALGQTAAAFLAATALTPQGGTPTAATFRALVKEIKGFPGVTSLILATDGGPNCDPDLSSCSTDMCTSNIDGLTNGQGVQVCFADGARNCCDPAANGTGLGCLDADATAKAIADLQAIGVQTYVMGIPGSAPYGGVLDQLAVAGGTARAAEPQYYAVNSADTAALGAAFQDIELRAMKSCKLVLSKTPANATRVNVYVDGTIVRAGGPDGWSLDGQEVTLEGAACGRVQSDGPAPAVTVVQGCPTVR